MSTEIAKDPGYSTELSKDTAYVMAYRPDYSLKKSIGVEVPLSDIFTAEKIASGNRIIEIGRNCFFMEAKEEIKKLLAVISPDAEVTGALPAVTIIAANLKGEVEMYGFSLIQKICSRMMETCNDMREKTDTKLAAIRNLTQALSFSVENKIRDDGGEAGKALLVDISSHRYESKTNP